MKIKTVAFIGRNNPKQLTFGTSGRSHIVKTVRKSRLNRYVCVYVTVSKKDEGVSVYKNEGSIELFYHRIQSDFKGQGTP